MLKITNIPPKYILKELNELSNALNLSIPPKRLDQNLILATWNIRSFGDLTRKWKSSNDDSPKRDLHSVLCIAEILSRFDVIAIQELKSNIRAFRDTLKILGDDWGFILTDVTKGDAGNGERMGFLFDRRRVKLSGLASELVVPKEWLNEISPDALQEQFARTPYAVGFKSANVTFVLVTLHILFGKKAKDRIPELKAIARWLKEWAMDMNQWHHSFFALGDFNIEKRGGLLHETFISEGLHIPAGLEQVTRSIFDKTKYYDHIAWYKQAKNTDSSTLKYLQSGNFDFVGQVLKKRILTKQQLSWHISDHYPLWAEFSLV